ncbi:MAG TPA: hypothetical protein VGW38_04295 [Chloroflexota bacterium]|nr:hypothetical protein [Chloroflexota bacterium]
MAQTPEEQPDPVKAARLMIASLPPPVAATIRAGIQAMLARLLAAAEGGAVERHDVTISDAPSCPETGEDRAT